MLKNLGYAGTYRDDNISVSVLLENPLEYGLEPTDLVFSVVFRAKNTVTLRLEDFTFYIMDEANSLYNTQNTPYSKPAVEIDYDDDEPMRNPDRLIYTGFKHDFFYQDLRIAFYYQHYKNISIIELKH